METERCPPKKSNVLKSRSSSSGSKSQKLGKSMVEFSKDQMCSRTEHTCQIDDELDALPFRRVPFRRVSVNQSLQCLSADNPTVFYELEVTIRLVAAD
ncbi:hypothetical protein HanRHA438_Chr13g0584441 [Helianthus annuus]|nr:hypothetical protein HanIR_Chr13g0624301 [Helianthus annuus]KAJ0847997.1 hypothetical protein HanPSC8_Chr13g0551991 [Helianthus annuus]KAJ0856950.1 hypothetical protein HanRHA438_Chr13g0584441 [Helianthus annuus]